MPQGYEDVKTLKDLRARKKQFDDVVTDEDFPPEFIRRQYIIRHWLFRHEWVRNLPWPTLQPLFFDLKTEFKCTSCLRKHLTHRLWWKSPTGSHICHHCYTKPDWSEIMPTGYEDVRTMKDLKARKKQLDELTSRHTIISHTPPSSHLHVEPRISQSTPTRPAWTNSNSASPSPSRKFSSTAVASITKEERAELRKNPELYARQLEKERQYRSKLRKNPELYARQSEKDRQRMQRYRNNIESRSKFLEVKRRWYSNNPMYHRLYLWCSRYAWLRDSLAWKSHRPLATEEKVRHHCDGCDFKPDYGLKLWWAMFSDSEPRYLCHKCYCTTRDWKDVMPKGYEEVKTIKEVKARKEQLAKRGIKEVDSATLDIPSSL